MRLSNFKMLKVTGETLKDVMYFAEVDVTTRALFLKRVERKMIARNYGGNWFFVDSGEFTPDLQAEALERGFDASDRLNKQGG